MPANVSSCFLQSATRTDMVYLMPVVSCPWQKRGPMWDHNENASSPWSASQGQYTGGSLIPQLVYLSTLITRNCEGDAKRGNTLQQTHKHVYINTTEIIDMFAFKNTISGDSHSTNKQNTLSTSSLCEFAQVLINIESQTHVTKQ